MKKDFDRSYFGRDGSNKYFTIAWNPGPDQMVKIDGIRAMSFGPSLCLHFDVDQSFDLKDRRYRCLAVQSRVLLRHR